MTSTTSQAVRDAREAVWSAAREVARFAADFVLHANNIDRPVSETPWLKPHRYGDSAYDARWYPVKDAQTGFHERVAVDAREALDAFESAVRTDEAAGLVDILARLVEGTLSNDDIECWWCGGYGRYSLTKDDEFEFAYLDHTPGCPWVEGMIAVAERLGQ